MYIWLSLEFFNLILYWLNNLKIFEIFAFIKRDARTTQTSQKLIKINLNSINQNIEKLTQTKINTKNQLNLLIFDYLTFFITLHQKRCQFIYFYFLICSTLVTREFLSTLKNVDTIFLFIIDVNLLLIQRYVILFICIISNQR